MASSPSAGRERRADLTRAPGSCRASSRLIPVSRQRTAPGVDPFRKSAAASRRLAYTSTHDSIVAPGRWNFDLAVPVIVNMEKSTSTPEQAGSAGPSFDGVVRDQPCARSETRSTVRFESATSAGRRRFCSSFGGPADATAATVRAQSRMSAATTRRIAVLSARSAGAGMPPWSDRLCTSRTLVAQQPSVEEADHAALVLLRLEVDRPGVLALRQLPESHPAVRTRGPDRIELVLAPEPLLARRDEEHAPGGLADVVAHRSDVRLAGQSLRPGEHEPRVRELEPFLCVDRVAVGAHAGALCDHGTQIGPPGGCLDQGLGAGGQTHRADPVAADVGPVPEKLDRRVDVRLPAPVEALGVAVALPAAARVVEQHAVAVTGQQSRLLPRALSVPAGAVDKDDRGAVS